MKDAGLTALFGLSAVCRCQALAPLQRGGAFVSAGKPAAPAAGGVRQAGVLAPPWLLSPHLPTSRGWHCVSPRQCRTLRKRSTSSADRVSVSTMPHSIVLGHSSME